jgi:hypothetical protein
LRHEADATTSARALQGQQRPPADRLGATDAAQSGAARAPSAAEASGTVLAPGPTPAWPGLGRAIEHRQAIRSDERSRAITPNDVSQPAPALAHKTMKPGPSRRTPLSSAPTCRGHYRSQPGGLSITAATSRLSSGAEVTGTPTRTPAFVSLRYSTLADARALLSAVGASRLWLLDPVPTGPASGLSLAVIETGACGPEQRPGCRLLLR